MAIPDIYKPNGARQQVQFKSVPTDSGSIGYQDSSGNVYNTREGGDLMWNVSDFTKNNPRGTIVGYNPSYEADLNDATTPRISGGQVIPGNEALQQQAMVRDAYNQQTQSEGAKAAAGPNLPQLANGQQAGGLQMPANGANLVYDPISGKQVSPAEKAFNETQASKLPPPQEKSSAVGIVSEAIKKNTPPAPAQTTTPKLDNYFATSPTWQQQTQELMDFLSPPEQVKQFEEAAAKIKADKDVLAGLNLQDMNFENLKAGTEEDIANEISKVGGIATSSQVKALAIMRNNVLIKEQNILRQKMKFQQDLINNEATLLADEKALAVQQFAQKSTVYQLVQKNQENIANAAKDAISTILNQPGGLQFYANDPQQAAYAEKVMGFAPGTISSLASFGQQQQNIEDIKATGATSPYIVTAKGEVQDATTGYAFNSQADFLAKTGMTTDEAGAKGLLQPLGQSIAQQGDMLDLKLKESQLKTDELQRKNIISQINDRNKPKDEEILSIDQAKALGVPYGTTKKEAISKGIIPGSGATDGDLTSEQSKARQFAVSAENANAILASSSYAPNIVDVYKPNLIQSPKQQVFEQAARAFVNATLRRESGATITDDEFKNKYKELIPAPGDGSEVIANKSAARSAAVQSIKEAGLLNSTTSTGGDSYDDYLKAIGQ